MMPNLIFDVKVDLTIRSRQDLENGKLDIAFIGGSVASGMLDSTPLGKLPMRWVGSPALLGKDAAKRTLAELLSRYPVWSLSKTSLLFPILASELDEKNSRVNVNMCDNITAMVGLLAAGAGIGILPEMLVSEELNSGQLVRIGKGRADTSLPFVAAWHSDEKQVAVLTLIELAKNVSTFI